MQQFWSIHVYIVTVSNVFLMQILYTKEKKMYGNIIIIQIDVKYTYIYILGFIA